MVGFFGVGWTGASFVAEVVSSRMVGVVSACFDRCDCNEVTETEGEGFVEGALTLKVDCSLMVREFPEASGSD